MINGIDAKDKWLIERMGKFTASENHKLLGKAKDGSMFGSVAMGYIKQKAVECLTSYWENPKMEFAKPLLHGKLLESAAFDHYCRCTRNNSMRYLGTENPLYFDYKDENGNILDAGGSPDGIMGQGEKVTWVLELKCPFNPSLHFEILQLKDQYDLKEYSPEWYCQVMFLIMTLKAEGAHFFSFDERYKDPGRRGKIIEVVPDKNYMNNLECRVIQAIYERDRIIACLQC